MMKFLRYFVPIFVFLFIWIPVIDHYYVSDVTITDNMIDMARHTPSDSLLESISKNEFNYLLSKTWENDTQLITVAEKILSGQFDIPGMPSTQIHIPFNADDIEKGLPGWKLYLSSLAIPDILIEAYEVSGRNDFLLTAKDIIVSWSHYERKAWLPKGLLWNDHAIAARILVFAKFWKHYRGHSDFQIKVARDIFQFVARSGIFLSDPSHFTFATNHGIMQNLALLHLSISFPTLPDIEEYKKLALDRLHDQMSFYINDEGIVLEHSAEYHRDGILFIGIALRYLAIMDMTIPIEWQEKYQKALSFYAQLRRPDGSLPMYGDTGYEKDSPPIVKIEENGRAGKFSYRNNWKPLESYSMYPVAGYSIWWDGLDKWPDPQQLNQTVVAWSYFPGQAHKHADEMSVLLYAGGQVWWTNAGYWKYGTQGRSEAVSWSGSNAPHIVGESYNSTRTTNLNHYGWSENLSAIDLQRSGPGEYVARRQVIHIKPNLWFVVDHTSGDKGSNTRTIWTTSNDVVISEGTVSHSYSLNAKDSRSILMAFFIASEGSKIERYRGSYSPFAGWVKNKPADAIILEQPANNSWSAVVWSLDNSGISSIQLAGAPYMQSWKSPESWKIILPSKSDRISIRRDGNSIYLNKNGDTNNIQELKLKPPPAGINERYTAIRTAYKIAEIKYPKFKAHLSYRWKTTYLLILILIFQEVFFIIYKRRKGTHYVGLRLFSILGWLSIIGFWQIVVYWKA